MKSSDFKDYDLSCCSVVTLYDEVRNRRFQLLVPTEFIPLIHLKDVVFALGCSGCFSSDCSDVIIDVLNSVRFKDGSKYENK